MMKATLIDCYLQGDEIILWLRDGNKNIKVRDSFIPEIFVSGKNLSFIQNKLSQHRIKSNFTKKKSFYNNRQITVLRIPIFKLSKYHSMIKYIERVMNYEIELYNADLKIEEAYLFSKGLFPTANVEYDLVGDKIRNIRANDDSYSLDYSIPQFKIANIKIITKENLHKTRKTQLTAIEYNRQKLSGEEKDILHHFKEAFNKEDPDIIWTENGNLILPFLKERFKHHNIDFNFNRFETDDITYEKGKSYWAYSVVYYRSASVFLKGRLHFDTRSFFADDTGFYGIIEGARVCRQRIQRIEMRSAGAAITNLLLYEAYKKNFLLPYKIGMYERFKTLTQLYESDRGAVIFEPQLGLHTDVVEFDFTSLYPQIMWRENLSPETLFCKCCNKKVPGLHYSFCEKNRGIVSLVAQNLITRRISLKNKKTLEANEKASYLKWLLVTMFGYQAFKNRKIGIIEIHESIQAYSREIMMKTVRIAESLGWTVVHGIVDSVYVKKKNYTKAEAEKLQKAIQEETGYIINLEGHYRWIVFLPSIQNASQPVSNHFYGIFENGEIKCRGIEARRKDTPRVISNMQTEMIESLSLVKNETEFKKSIPIIIKILKNYIQLLEHASADDLSITKRISKLDYTNNIPQKLLADIMTQDGWDIHPGQSISYIIKNSKSKNPKSRYIPSHEFKGVFDKSKYINMMIKSTFNLLQPFNLTEDYLHSKLKDFRQASLSEYEVMKILVEK